MIDPELTNGTQPTPSASTDALMASASGDQSVTPVPAAPAGQAARVVNAPAAKKATAKKKPLAVAKSVPAVPKSVPVKSGVASKAATRAVETQPATKPKAQPATKPKAQPAPKPAARTKPAPAPTLEKSTFKRADVNAAAVKTVVKTALKPAKKVEAAPTPKPEAKSVKLAAKPKEKLVRDSFTMPQADFALIASLKNRALLLKRPTKKSELLRAGLHALQALTSTQLMSALNALVPLKAGRPKRDAG